jgi:hypothetical protein
MCATVCPSEALFFGTLEEFQSRRKGTPVNQFQFGAQTVTTKVFMVLPDGQVRLDVDPFAHVELPQTRFSADAFDHVDPFAHLEPLPTVSIQASVPGGD